MKFLCLSQAWQRPTLPRLKTKYHWRWGDLRPSSGWDRVWTPRQSHQAGERQKHVKERIVSREALFVPPKHSYKFLHAIHFSHAIWKRRLFRRGSYQWIPIMRIIKPFEQLVPVSYKHCCSSTPGLSTRSSSSALKGILVLRWVSRLDAFSGYPVHT